MRKGCKKFPCLFPKVFMNSTQSCTFTTDEAHSSIMLQLGMKYLFYLTINKFQHCHKYEVKVYNQINMK